MFALLRPLPLTPASAAVLLKKLYDAVRWKPGENAIVDLHVRGVAKTACVLLSDFEPL